ANRVSWRRARNMDGTLACRGRSGGNKLRSIPYLVMLAGVSCGYPPLPALPESGDGPLSGVQALVILQRPKRNDVGDIFQYTSYMPGARLVKLEPPTGDGTLTTLCCDKAGAEFTNIDISDYDLSFDAKSIVFSGKLSSNQTYGLFLLQLSDGSVTQIMT